MGLRTPCSLVLAAAFYLSAGQSAAEYLAANNSAATPMFAALQIHQPTKEGNVTRIHPTEEPAAPSKATLDPAQLQREGQELLDLAQSLQADIESLNHGVHPKDTLDKLKRIQKVAKHLRGEIAP